MNARSEDVRLCVCGTSLGRNLTTGRWDRFCSRECRVAVKGEPKGLPCGVFNAERAALLERLVREGAYVQRAQMRLGIPTWIGAWGLINATRKRLGVVSLSQEEDRQREVHLGQQKQIYRKRPAVEGVTPTRFRDKYFVGRRKQRKEEITLP